MTLEIEPVEEGEALRIRDPVERRQVSLEFPSPVAPSPADADAFVYPVDRAVSVTADAVAIEGGAAATVLDPSGTVQANLNEECWTDELPPGEYYLDVSSHVKTYLRVAATDPVELEYDADATRLEVAFGGETELLVGARAVHERPAATITTTTAPRDMMTAVSYLGSALNDHGPMRSFPTLRGHPPEIELGDELRVPDELQQPDTGLTIEVPPKYEYIYPVAPLAYYLGARVVPGREPRLVADTGFEHALEGPGGFEAAVERLLKQVFTCDCYVRSGGPFSYDLARREAFVEDTGLDPDAVYDEPLAEQVEAYLRVPFEVVEPYVPEWGVATHLEAMPESVEYLPFLADDLAVIRSPAVEETAAPSVRAATGGASGFTRGAAAATTAASVSGPDIADRVGGPGEPTVGVTDTGPPTLSWPGERPSVVVPEALDAQEQRWIGAGIPLGAGRPTLEAYRNALDRDPVDGEIELTVVCNDDRMIEESAAVRELLSDETPFDVSVRPFRNVRTDELREILERGGDFLHYIGHIDERGFACRDGYLDAATLSDVGVDVFFLNACGSYEQGRHLVDAGAIAGVVTLDEVQNSEAVETGRTMARLLNDAFPLDAALRVASEEHGLEDYTVVGDGAVQIVQAESSAHLITLDRVGPETFEYRLETYVTPQFGIGAAYAPTMAGIDGWYLFGDHVEATVSRDDVRGSMYEDAPVRVDGELGRTTDLVERLRKVDAVREPLDELVDLTLERAGDGADPETGTRRRRLREEIDDAFTEFDAEDFRVAYRALSFGDGADPDGPAS